MKPVLLSGGRTSTAVEAPTEDFRLTRDRLVAARKAVRKAAERMDVGVLPTYENTELLIMAEGIIHWANMIKSKLCNGCAEDKR